jgi:hypothetical protein
VTARAELNPDLHEEGQYIYMLTAEGRQQYLSNSMEGERFALACMCQSYHVRYTTLHSIAAAHDLFCQWCECDDDSWEGRGKDPVSAAEREAMHALQSAGLDHTTACQVLLTFWPGRVDFYHIPSGTAVQADGSSHFECMHHRAPHHQLLSDIECCARAWREGVRLLRVHHKYACTQEAIIVATQLPHARFVMLSGCYASVRVWHKGQHIGYIDLLKSKLQRARCQSIKVPGCVVFY